MIKLQDKYEELRIMHEYRHKPKKDNEKTKEDVLLELMRFEKTCKELTTGNVPYSDQSRFINAFKFKLVDRKLVNPWSEKDKQGRLEIFVKYFPKDSVDAVCEYVIKEKQRQEIMKQKELERQKEILRRKEEEKINGV